MEIGIFGGTFDPVHNGHMAIAKAAIQKFELDRLLVMPTRIPPHKTDKKISPYHQRFAMVAMATMHEPKMIPFSVPEDLNYAVGEVGYIKTTFPNDRIWYLIGMDSFLELEMWKEPRLLCSMVNLIVSHRPGYNLNRVPNTGFYNDIWGSTHFLEVFMRIAATDIRGALAKHDPVSSYLLRRNVREYIQKVGLYEG